MERLLWLQVLNIEITTVEINTEGKLHGVILIMTRVKDDVPDWTQFNIKNEAKTLLKDFTLILRV